MISFVQYDSAVALTVRLRNSSGQFWDFVGLAWVAENSSVTNVAYSEVPNGNGTSLYTVEIAVPPGGPFIQEAVLPSGEVVATDTAISDSDSGSGAIIGSGGNYTSLEQVALFLNLNASTLTPMERTQLLTLIPYADGVINNYCGYTLAAQDYADRRYNGTGGSTLDLGFYQINAVESVRVKAADGTFTDVTEDIEILEDGIIQFLPEIGGVFTSGTLNWYVSFNAGFPTIPTDIAFAATYLVSINFNKISTYLIGVSEQTATGITTKYDSIELPVLVKRVLDRYRKISIF